MLDWVTEQVYNFKNQFFSFVIEYVVVFQCLKTDLINIAESNTVYKTTLNKNLIFIFCSAIFVNITWDKGLFP